jgi:DNA-binding protein HU-beta
MTKADIVNSISDNVGVEKKETQKVVEAFMDEVRKALQSGNNVYLRGFGTFQIKQRKEKKGRNITSNTTVTIPAHNIPAFKPSKEFVVAVKNNVEIK